MLQCDICSLDSLDEFTLQTHLTGKKHLKRVQVNEQRKLVEASIFVRSLGKETKKSQIITFFNSFGKVVSHNIKPTHAIIQFSNKQTVDDILRKKVIFQNRELKIERQAFFVYYGSEKRKVELNDPDKDTSSISYKRLCTIFEKQSTFDQQFSQFLDAIQLSDTELRNRYDPICTHLNKIFSTVFPTCKTYKFGSTQTGLAFKESDLDVYMDVGTNTQFTMGRIFKDVKNIMYKKRAVFSNIAPIPKAKMPIIKFCYTPTDVNCDISFKFGIGIWNSRIIHYCLSLDVRLKPLMMLIKYWARHLQISGTGKMSNYALIMLIIFFLQQPSVRIIPPLTRFRNDCQPVTINGWQINFDANKKLPVITNNKSVVELLKEFFIFYGNFCFKSNVICPLNGMVYPEEDFLENTQNLPACMKSYTDTISMKDPTTLLRVNGPICVQDPIELNRNITASTTRRILDSFQAYCLVGAEICTSTAENNYEGLLKSLFTTTIKPEKTRRSVIVLEAGLYLESGLPESVKSRTDISDKQEFIHKHWYFTIFNIIKDFFEKVMLMEVEVLCIDNEAKQQKIETLSDVHTKEHCKLKLKCKGYKCVWQSREKYEVNVLDPSLSALDKEIITSKRIIDETTKEGEDKSIKLVFVCTLKRKKNPVGAVLELENVRTDKELMKGCYKFVKNTIPKTINATLMHMQQFKKHY